MQAAVGQRDLLGREHDRRATRLLERQPRRFVVAPRREALLAEIAVAGHAARDQRREAGADGDVQVHLVARALAHPLHARVAMHLAAVVAGQHVGQPRRRRPFEAPEPRRRARGCSHAAGAEAASATVAARLAAARLRRRGLRLDGCLGTARVRARARALRPPLAAAPTPPAPGTRPGGLPGRRGLPRAARRAARRAPGSARRPPRCAAGIGVSPSPQPTRFSRNHSASHGMTEQDGREQQPTSRRDAPPAAGPRQLRQRGQGEQVRSHGHALPGPAICRASRGAAKRRRRPACRPAQAPAWRAARHRASRSA